MERPTPSGVGLVVAVVATLLAGTVLDVKDGAGGKSRGRWSRIG